MKSEVMLGCAVMAMLATAGLAQTNGTQMKTAALEQSRIAGVWRADADGLPFIALTIDNETGNLSGAVLFYLHRHEMGQPVTSTPGVPEPLLNPKFDGTTFAFEVSHRRAHPPASLNDKPVSFRMKLTGPDSAEFVNGNESGIPFVLKRADY
jgi:hypothetical protein